MTQAAIEKLPFPVDAGSWLACYRHRTSSGQDGPLSPEEVGRRLGVSGRTVRRWESNDSRPTHTDLNRFAKLCGLTSLEEEFLHLTWSSRAEEWPPETSNFHAQAIQLLSGDFPAFLYDSLFYVRGWNSYAQLLFPGMAVGQTQMIRTAIRLLPPGSGKPTQIISRGSRRESREDRIHKLVRHFWLSTASLCGSQPYRRLLHELRQVEGFDLLWQKLAGGEGTEPANVSLYFGGEDLGIFRQYFSRVVLPPEYQLREFVPVDDHAMQRCREAQQQVPLTVTLDACFHWSSNPQITG